IRMKVTSIAFISYFFYQAEDGIRDRNVTGVQTCALPISFTSYMMPPFYGMPQENVTLDSMLNQIDDLNLENLEAKLSSLSNAAANQSSVGVDNHQMGVDVANSSLGSMNVLRRSSLLKDCSAPINIPGK